MCIFTFQIKDIHKSSLDLFYFRNDRQTTRFTLRLATRIQRKLGGGIMMIPYEVKRKIALEDAFHTRYDQIGYL